MLGFCASCPLPAPGVNPPRLPPRPPRPPRQSAPLPRPKYGIYCCLQAPGKQKKSMIRMRLNSNQHKMYKWFNIFLSSGGKLNRFFIQFFCMFFLLLQQKVKIKSENYPRCDWHSNDSSGPRLIHKM
jgi:hypothetical protein